MAESAEHDKEILSEYEAMLNGVDMSVTVGPHGKSIVADKDLPIGHELLEEQALVI